MSGQQGSASGQGIPPPGDQESTQVGMPVPPPTPGVLRPDAPPGYPQQPYPPSGTGYAAPPPGYGPTPPGYGPTPPGYGPTPPGYGPTPPGYGPARQSGYSPAQQPSYPPTQPPGYPPAPPHGYGVPPPGSGYPPPPPGYGYAAPLPRRGGISPLLVGLLVLLLVVGLGVGGMYVAHIGPFAVTGSPQPTLIGQASPSPSRPAASATPTPFRVPPTLPATTPPLPTASPTVAPATLAPTQSPSLPPSSPSTADEELLREHVPQLIADTCASAVVEAPELAGVTCTANDGAILVAYTLYPDATSMESAYDIKRLIYAADAGSATCEESTNWPSEYEYNIGAEAAGRVYCSDFLGLTQMFWTDTRFNILSGSLFATAGTRDDMYAFWRDDSGPY